MFKFESYRNMVMGKVIHFMKKKKMNLMKSTTT